MCIRRIEETTEMSTQRANNPLSTSSWIRLTIYSFLNVVLQILCQVHLIHSGHSLLLLLLPVSFVFYFWVCPTFFIINRCTFVICVVSIAAPFNIWHRNRFKSVRHISMHFCENRNHCRGISDLLSVMSPWAIQNWSEFNFIKII